MTQKKKNRSKEEIKADMGEGYKKLTTIQEALREMGVKFATRDNIIDFLIDTTKTVYTTPEYVNDEGVDVPEEFKHKKLLYHIQDYIDLQKQEEAGTEIKELNI